MTIEKGFGYVPVEARRTEKMEVGTIALDAIFTPIRKINYEVENMRVGDRTDYNRLRFMIETDGTISPEDAFTKGATILVEQFKELSSFAAATESVIESAAAHGAVKEGEESHGVSVLILVCRRALHMHWKCGHCNSGRFDREERNRGACIGRYGRKRHDRS
jgi:DNA-directed RNA polymerase subunit alpha